MVPAKEALVVLLLGEGVGTGGFCLIGRLQHFTVETTFVVGGVANIA